MRFAHVLRIYKFTVSSRNGDRVVPDSKFAGKGNMSSLVEQAIGVPCHRPNVLSD